MQRVQEEKERINQLRATLRKDAPARSPQTPAKASVLTFEDEGTGSMMPEERAPAALTAEAAEAPPHPSAPVAAKDATVQLDLGASRTLSARSPEAPTPPPQRAKLHTPPPPPQQQQQTPVMLDADLAGAFCSCTLAFATAALAFVLLAVAEWTSGHLLK